jgi:hypothetical protein
LIEKMRPCIFLERMGKSAIFPMLTKSSSYELDFGGPSIGCAIALITSGQSKVLFQAA